MMHKKILASIILFGFLFAGAWVLEAKDKREFFYSDTEEEMVEVMPAESGQGPDKRKIKAFESREYVRVEAGVDVLPHK
ncbi:MULTISPECIES: hypothetical protein [Bacillaceae]|nr:MULTISPECIES: hypothetical protein [Bacillus]EAR64153.1 hypothetical protein B14911_24651 [Bacillus sp. NRRL B-14911]MCA1033951.1 hypothetical protein [Bacillus infantis]MCP1160246.1 hypothetical protein [Bacillus infantis]MDW2879769.1 hypothetical protein [Bacillus infantis]RYI26005.1 hypothetical protein EVU96_22450 [Bacillus infantis]